MSTDVDAFPQTATFSTFEVRRTTSSGDEWKVRIRDTYRYLFDGKTEPGWLGSCKFPSFQEAVQFGRQLGVYVKSAADSYGEMAEAKKRANDLICKAKTAHIVAEEREVPPF